MTQRILLQFGLMRNGPGPQRFSAPFQGGTYHVEQQPADGSWTVRYTCANKELAMNGERVFQSLREAYSACTRDAAARPVIAVPATATATPPTSGFAAKPMVQAAAAGSARARGGWLSKP